MQKQWTLIEAALKINVPYRQAKRIYWWYVEEGDRGLLHKSLRKASGRAYDLGLRETVLRLYQERYGDLGPTFAAGLKGAGARVA